MLNFGAVLSKGLGVGTGTGSELLLFLDEGAEVTLTPGAWVGIEAVVTPGADVGVGADS